MNKADLYSTANSLQRRDAHYVIDKYKHTLKSEDCDLTLDIGCGSGDVTVEVLQKLTNGFVIGTDISSEMIKFAKVSHKYPKLRFQQFDIVSKSVPLHFMGQFDHVVSFYCMHWIQDQRRAYMNIYNLLKHGGDMLVTFLANNPIFHIYESISKLPKWKTYMTDVKNFVSPFQHSKRPDEELKKMLESIGFKVKICKLETRSFVYEGFQAWKKSIQAVNPFIDRIPENLRDEYMNEIVNQITMLNLIDQQGDTQTITAIYDLLTVCAVKK